MSEQKPDWDAIQREYEQGRLSYRELAAKYEVSFNTLYSRARRKWLQTANSKQQTEDLQTANIRVIRSEFPSPPDAVAGANLGLKALVKYLEDSAKLMDLADHVKAATALSQYNRIIINAPEQEPEDEEQEDFSGFTDEELRLYAELQERAKKRA